MKYKIFKRFKILKRHPSSYKDYICIDSTLSNRSRHMQNFIDTIVDVDYFNTVDVNFGNYELLYEFDSIEEFKEQYPEEFI